ncbi:hypothetical protein LRX75_11395 [Rhizobium sp. DKSPLA3]|uniref:Uncharacterized protein n=1 Tax=Rhizobium quercicola TaxID=2901226 RepID=A0A9X1NRG9_9HYPH|nr:hypothetical protein [Rhizobium quercicola]MCD7109650.1 hypothetical protein [Rhizobium quercicola]
MFFKAKSVDTEHLESELDRLKAKVRAFSLFDEDDYLDANPDVRKAVQDGAYKDGLTHFRNVGLKEGRFPGYGSFNWELYLSSHDDLAHFKKESDPEAIARRHFREAGYREGRTFS